MEKIVGGFAQSVGTVILGFSLCVQAAKQYINFDWKEMPCEIKLFLFFLGITNRHKYLDLFKGKEVPSPEHFTVTRRVIIALPFIGLCLVVVGTILTLF
jgi:hypothetical protein